MKNCLLTSLAFCFAASAPAALVAHYDFTDGNLLDNEVGPSFTLTNVGGVTTTPEGAAKFTSGPDYLFSPAFGTLGISNFTVSFWFRTDNLAQGDFDGLFSNDAGSATSFSWQLDNSGSNFRLVSTGNPNLTYPESNIAVDTWYHTVVRKVGSSVAVYMTPEGSGTVNQVMSGAFNPGGLNEFRLGVNRNADNFFAMEMANVKIYTDSSVDLDTLLSEGPQIVPEPSRLTLAALALLGLLGRRRRR